MMRRALWWSGAAILAIGVLSPASARPQYLAVFKEHYKTADSKPTLNKANCAMCHVGKPADGKWNAYGNALKAALGKQNVRDKAVVEKAIVAVEERKAGPNARRTFGQQIAADRLPVQPRANANAPAAPAPGNNAAIPPGARTQSVTMRPLGPWEAIFDGTDMSNVTKMNAGTWAVKNGLLTYNGVGNGWLRTNKQYKNYSCVIVWRFPNAGDNDSGVFLNAGLEGSPWPRGAAQLNMGPGQNIGSLSATQGSRNRYDLIHPNDWNTFQITVKDGECTLAINNQVAWEGAATGAAINKPGYIGIENEGKVIEIKSWHVLPLE
jgi:hypothetical protein